MKTIVLATAAAIALSAPAFAQSQLETSLGVDAGAYTTAELIQLDRAFEENDKTRINFILSGGSNLDAGQIEARGIAAAVDRAIEEGDYTHASNLAENRGGVVANSTASSRNVGSVPGWLQNVADDLGVNAGDFTRGELITLARHVEEGDQAAVNGIISRVVN